MLLLTWLVVVVDFAVVAVAFVVCCLAVAFSVIVVAAVSTQVKNNLFGGLQRPKNAPAGAPEG